jgi:hypothetical protein
MRLSMRRFVGKSAAEREHTGEAGSLKATATPSQLDFQNPDTPWEKEVNKRSKQGDSEEFSTFSKLC